MEFKKGLESPGQVVRACTMICGVQKQVGKPQNCRKCKDASDIGKQMDGWMDRCEFSGLWSAIL